MKLAFEKQEVACLKPTVCQTQNMEQTQELRLPEGLDGQIRILGTWGQPVMRSKQWQSDCLMITGGVLVRVLCEPETGGDIQTLDTWIPFKLEWDLEPDSPEGAATVQLSLRNLDARPVSAGKILIRAGIAALAQCWIPHREAVWKPGEVPEDVALLRQHWPVQLPKEVGEKSFMLEDQLTLPHSAPAVDKILYFRMEPMVTDRKVLGNKIVFRGNGNLHILYLDEENKVRNWDFELPFSQYAELSDSYSPDAQAEVVMAQTRLELEPNGEGKLELHAGLTGQYLVENRELVETVADAYSPWRNVEIQKQPLSLPGILDSRREVLSGEKVIPIQADGMVDVTVMPDFPRQRREADTVQLEAPGMAQMLYYDEEGRLQSALHRWEAATSVKADREARLQVWPMTPQMQILPGTDSMTLRTELPVQVTTMTGEELPMVTGCSLGEKQEPDPGRPCLILRRAGQEQLWDIARDNGSTIEAIRLANGIEHDPNPDQMLLIPVV